MSELLLPLSDQLAFMQLRCNNISRDPEVHILSTAIVGSLARFVAAGLIMILLLLPVIIVNALNGRTAKMVTIMISCAIFIMCLPSLTRANVKETVIAGTT